MSRREEEIRRLRANGGSAADLLQMQNMSPEEASAGYAVLMRSLQQVGFSGEEIVEMKLILSVCGRGLEERSGGGSGCNRW
jgi:hypothetical protein